MGISSKINLAALPFTSVRKFKNKAGEDVECLVIPIEKANLFRGDKGVYLSLQGFDIKNKTGDSKDTHLVKQSLDKAKYDALTEEEKKAIPVLGGHVLWPEAGQMGDAPVNVQDENDDLGF